IAYRLFSHTQITGSLWMPEKFRPSCQSPSLVAPSPNQHPTTASSVRYLMAYAMPAACGIWVAMGEEAVMMFSRRDPQWAGIWRPPDEGSSALANTPRNTSRGVIPATRQTAMSREYGRNTSSPRLRGHAVGTWH